MSIWDKPEQRAITKTSTQSDGRLRIYRFFFEMHLRPLTGTQVKTPSLSIQYALPPVGQLGFPLVGALDGGARTAQVRSHLSWLPGTQQMWAPPPPRKLGRFGKAGPVFFTATVGWAKCLGATLVGLSCPVCHGSAPTSVLAPNSRFAFYPIASALFLEQC